MSPVIGRYMDRSWSHGVGHRLYDTAGREYLDFANGIAVTTLGHAHPRVTAADPRPGRPADGPGPRDRLLGADGPAGPDARRHVPGPARLGPVPQLGLGDHRRRAQARPPGHRAARDHRVPRRVPRPDVRRDERHHVEPQLPDRLRAAPAGRLLRAVPGDLPRVRRRRGGRDGVEPRDPAVAAGHDHRPLAGGGDPHRARPGRGRLLPGAGRVHARAAGAVRRARDPADRRRGAVGLRPDGRDVGVRARGDRPRRRVRGEGDRQRPAAVGDRDPARARRAVGSRRARVDVRRQPGRLRRRRRRARDDPRRAAGRERPRPRDRADAAACAS